MYILPNNTFLETHNSVFNVKFTEKIGDMSKDIVSEADNLQHPTGFKFTLHLTLHLQTDSPQALTVNIITDLTTNTPPTHEYPHSKFLNEYIFV